ncbi:Alpha-hemolysin translocation ATP-binding protein HlyB [Rosistilla carotiformis]|uniref:Alpha-hemolysin translocation ATP-binding protein HlyB n=1 Tax=Rosistilla carotiformis TaxID=2528017 RepID=A0A518JUQ0_9BACT|nr:ABC transporter ATP-binding protein [Rosistilla carotiformis]QDV69281.1 Alpha-hemolysin translocation ATP-binding protein HlyB [Rosistilla carotiformis]
MKQHKSQCTGAISILEKLASANPVLERDAPRRAMFEVVEAWPGDPHRLWWKWFSEATISLGLRTKTIDGTVAEVCRLAALRAPLICYREQANDGKAEWLGVVGANRKRFQVVVATEDSDETHSVSPRGLRKMLRNYAKDGNLRCVVVQSDKSLSMEASGPGKKLEPNQRLWKLLRPESSDIWLVVLFAFVVSLLMLASPMAVEALVNTVAFGRFLQPIVILSAILLTFLSFQGAIRALQTYVVEIIQRRLFARVAGDLAFRLPRVETEPIDGEYLPEVVNRFFDVTTIQKVAAQLLLDGVGLILNTVIGMAVLAFYHPWLLGFDLFLVAAIAIIVFVLGRGAVDSAIKESKHKYYMAGWLEDIARCPTAFRSDGGADFAMVRADRMVAQYLTARSSHFAIVMRQVLFALGLQAVSSTVLLGLGGWLVVAGELTLGQLVAAELIVTVIVGSFAKFGKHMESFYDLLASVDKLGVLFDLQTQRDDGMLTWDGTHPASLELHALTYKWDGAVAILDSLEASVEGGERIAIHGGSGSGKSTLLDLIFGLRSPSAGFLTIDGTDPRDLRPDVLRSRVAMARPEVFHASVEENVDLRRDDVTATEVRDVLRSLGLLDPVLRLKDGCDTVLASDGAPLSTNQSRILTLARATIGQPGLLLVDGVLDGLGGTELDQCLEYLMAPHQSWTLIVATCREDIAARFTRTIDLGIPTAADNDFQGGVAR